jgi:hypothetical protein
MKAAAWADALDLKNAGAALFEPDLDHLRMLAERVTAPSVGLPVRGDRRLFVRRPYTTSAPPPPRVQPLTDSKRKG